ncbi:hypothetical protein PIB30_044233 [Stylosanthes scabra]|uniref:Uncharacterized protein n=1 Tax=Stylosanthes scabra TaxID=79078 RepID=A0ABU6WG33_9FABA|nr:hypothetical protein [Stylosanthes scabra]
MSLFNDVHQGMSNQLMEEAYLFSQGYTPWNPPPHPYSEIDIKETFQLLCQERKELRENQRRVNAQLTTLTLSMIRLVTQFTNGNSDNSMNISQPSNSGDLPSRPLSNPWGRIGTLFLCTNQEGREDALLNEDDVESLYHEDMHECLEEVEEENEAPKAEYVDQEVDKEPKRMNIFHSVSSKATPSKLPSELQFQWVNFPNLNSIGPQHYALFITCGKLDFKSYSGYLHKLHNNRAKAGAFSLRKHLGLWQFQEKLVDSYSNGWTNQVWDPGKSFKNHHFWGVITCVGVFRDLLNMNWDPIKNTKFKHW